MIMMLKPQESSDELNRRFFVFCFRKCSITSINTKSLLNSLALFNDIKFCNAVMLSGT